MQVQENVKNVAVLVTAQNVTARGARPVTTVVVVMTVVVMVCAQTVVAVAREKPRDEIYQGTNL